MKNVLVVLVTIGLVGCVEAGGDYPQTQPPINYPSPFPSGADAGTPQYPNPTPKYDAAPRTPTAPAESYFAEDPPTPYCGPGGADEPPLPGGTPECPDDKNREGCACRKVGETAPCWPGFRVDRGKGICQDGVTTCIGNDEFGGVWGACEGYTLPDPDATRGPAACNCFSAGVWNIQNTSPCFSCSQTGKGDCLKDINANATYAAKSTWIDSSGRTQCDTRPAGANPWSKSKLTVDCAGQFKLCFAIRVGDAANPSSDDCLVGKSCTEAWYGEAGVEQDLPSLPAWSTEDSSCVRKFLEHGGYGEMTVIGQSKECEPIDDNGDPLVFQRVEYCSMRCSRDPSAADCPKACVSGSSGEF